MGELVWLSLKALRLREIGPTGGVRTTQWPMQIVLGLCALVLKGRTSDLGTWGKGMRGLHIGSDDEREKVWGYQGPRMSMDSSKKGVFTIKRILRNSSKGLRSVDSCVDKRLRNL